MVHRAVPGGYDPSTREGKRTAIFGERPFFDPSISKSWTERKERLNKEDLRKPAPPAYDEKTNGNLVNGSHAPGVTKIEFEKLNVV